MKRRARVAIALLAMLAIRIAGACSSDDDGTADGTAGKLGSGGKSGVDSGSWGGAGDSSLSDGTSSGGSAASDCGSVVTDSGSEGPAPPVIVPCASSASASCASFVGGDGKTANVWLADGALSRVDSQMMGSFTDYLGHQLAYVYATDDQNVPHLYVVDVTDAKLIAWLSVPAKYTVYDTYFGAITDPNGIRYPFLAPGAHYLVGSSDPGPWDFLCVFDPASITNPDASCFTGFKHYSATFTTSSGSPAAQASGYRHNGGWVDDVDGDGWSDIHLPFLQYILSVSGKTGQQLSLAHFDVAKASEPTSPDYFHSGRFYGSFTSLNDPSTGTRTVLIASGNSVGTFTDAYCNVSRFMAAFKWENTAQLVWSRYYSFAKTIFNPPYDSVQNYSRLGDDLNECIHRFSDSLLWAGSVPVTIFSVWKNIDPTPVCQSELLAQQASNFTDQTYETCVSAVLPKQGRWSIQALKALDGNEIGVRPNSYLWGRVPNLMPCEPYALVAETFIKDDGVLRFDQQGHTPERFEMFSLEADLKWHESGAIAEPGSQPKLVARYDYYGAYPVGLGATWGGIPELVVSDTDGDGLNEFQLQNGSWVGYSTSQGQLVIK